jgi:hypothetical protein
MKAAFRVVLLLIITLVVLQNIRNRRALRLRVPRESDLPAARLARTGAKAVAWTRSRSSTTSAIAAGAETAARSTSRVRAARALADRATPAAWDGVWAQATS